MSLGIAINSSQPIKSISTPVLLEAGGGGFKAYKCCFVHLNSSVALFTGVGAQYDFLGPVLGICI